MEKLLLATGNPGKVRELRALLAPLEVQLVAPPDLGLRLDVPERGATYGANAARKALAFARAAGMPALADDSGLEVDALGGAPGLRSARYDPTPGATDADRRARLLGALAAHPRPWRARFRCVVAFATPDDLHALAEGVCPGEIVAVPRGEGGFGYDPIFQVSGEGRTMAELGPARKNEVSHRARAVRGALPFLEIWIAGGGIR